jgi:uncharacterized protein (TIGR02145 family)
VQTEAYRQLQAVTKGTALKDSRDNKTYKKILIGEQTWMAENLNYDVGKSKCYGNDASNCEQYGRLYDWPTAMSACPVGWHLPRDSEWKTLTDYAGGEKKAGKKLKATAGWKGKNGNGTDDYGFSALSGGFGGSFNDFGSIGNSGLWWSATERNHGNAWSQYMNYGTEGVDRRNYNKTSLFSVRCVQD